MRKSKEEKVKKVKPGNIIKIPKKLQVEMFERHLEIDSLKNSLETISKQIFVKEKLFWDFIKEIFPETKDYIISYNKKDHTITIKTKMSAYQLDMDDLKYDMIQLIQHAKADGTLYRRDPSKK